jgi:hypothetical protein
VLCKQRSIASYCFRGLGTALLAVLGKTKEMKWAKGKLRGAVNCFLVVSEHLRAVINRL